MCGRRSTRGRALGCGMVRRALERRGVPVVPGCLAVTGRSPGSARDSRDTFPLAGQRHHLHINGQPWLTCLFRGATDGRASLRPSVSGPAGCLRAGGASPGGRGVSGRGVLGGGVLGVGVRFSGAGGPEPSGPEARPERDQDMGWGDDYWSGSVVWHNVMLTARSSDALCSFARPSSSVRSCRLFPRPARVRRFASIAGRRPQSWLSRSS